MKAFGGLVFTVGSLSGAVTQWVLIWLFAHSSGGAEAVGAYSLTIAVVTPVFIIGQFGLRTVYLSLRTNISWSSYLILRLSGIGFSLLFVWIYVQLTSSGSPELWAAVVFLKCGAAYSDILYARYQRQNRLTMIGLHSLVNSVATIIVAWLIIRHTGSIALTVFGAGIISLLTIISAQYFVRSFEETESPLRGGYKHILRAGLPTTISEGFAAASTYMPILFLSVTGDVKVAGIYASAAYLLTFANLSGAILKNALITSFRHSFEQHGIERLMRESHKTALAISVFAVLAVPVIIFAGSPVLQLIYGEEFALNYLQLTLLAVAALPITASYIYDGTLNILNAYAGQAWIWFTACVCGVGVAVACVAIPGIPAMVGALLVAMTTAWVRFLGAFGVALRVQRRSRVARSTQRIVR